MCPATSCPPPLLPSVSLPSRLPMEASAVICPELKTLRYSRPRFGYCRVESIGTIVRSELSSMAQKYGVSTNAPRKRVIPRVGNRKPEARGEDGSGWEKYGA